MSGEFVELGRVVSVHGVGGEVMVRTAGDTPEGLGRYPSLGCLPPRGEERRLEIESLRVHKGMALVRFRGVADRNEAERLIGSVLRVSREELHPAGEGRHYVIDLIGLEVETSDGRKVGRVRQVLETGANDVYVVDAGGREVLIPAVDRIVTSVDVAAGRIVIEALDGLLD